MSLLVFLRITWPPLFFLNKQNFPDYSVNIFLLIWPDFLLIISVLTGCWLAELSLPTGAAADLGINTRE